MSRGQRTLLCCLISAVLCGVITASQCPTRSAPRREISPLDESCAVAPALQVAHPRVAVDWFQSTEYTVPLALWLNWINWTPGVVFGILFALANVGLRASGRMIRVVLSGIASGLIYLIAGFLFTRVYAALDMLPSGEPRWFIEYTPGFIAGLSGALLLALSTMFLIGTPFATRLSVARMCQTSAIGALMGVPFVFICTVGPIMGTDVIASWPMAFIVWQVPVGLSLAGSTERRIAAPAGSDSQTANRGQLRV